MPACRQAFVTFVLLALLACGGGDGNGDTSGEDVNNRGQIAVRVVDYEDATARVRSFILTPE